MLGEGSPASIEFTSATPQVLALKGSGGTETSVIKFTVKDGSGNALTAVSVSLSITGPNGGEFIDPSTVFTDGDGIAQAGLNSGSVAGPVTIVATVTGTTITGQSALVSIGGGVPSAKFFSIAAEKLNLPGLVYNNRTTNITAYLADRFGNYNVLKGTSVTFVTEVGLAIDTSNTVQTEEDGLATVTLRTQQPSTGGPEDVAIEAWETDWQTVLADYGIITTAHPRDGLCSILVYLRGEEHFDDSNANGVYDAGETFVDTDDDPFMDYNDNDQYDGPASADPEEIYVDSGSDGSWDGTNGQWDEDKFIFANFTILITGEPWHIGSNPATFNVADGGTQGMRVAVADQNLNRLTAGSTFSITTDVGGLRGSTGGTVVDSNVPGPLFYQFSIYDANPGDDDDPESGFITVRVTWEGVTYPDFLISGTVD